MLDLFVGFVKLGETTVKENIMKKKLAALLVAFGFLSACGEAVPPREAALGDTVIINFAGFMDGVQFEGGTAAGFPLQLGSGMFVPGFEEQVVGARVGDTVNVNIVFPEDYFPALSGRPALFIVEVVDIR